MNERNLDTMAMVITEKVDEIAKLKARIAKLTEEVELQKQWYPFEQDQRVHVTFVQGAYAPVLDAVFVDREDAQRWADLRAHDGDTALELVIEEGRIPGLRVWDNIVDRPPATLLVAPRAVIIALTMAAEMACDHSPEPRAGADDVASNDKCEPCMVRQSARDALRALGMDVPA